MNSLAGEIPESFGSLPNLEKVYLGDNSLSGFIPELTTQPVSLLEFLASDNKFVGSIPSGYADLPVLQNFTLANNTLTGVIPAFNSPNLTFIDLKNNRLTGTIPESIFDSGDLRVLYLSNNVLSGTIPASYSKPPKLTDLWLNENDLTGTIPNPSPGQLQKIEEILLTFNSLREPVPDGLCQLRLDLPVQFFALQVDCAPRPGTDEINNECELNVCCTGCERGRGPQDV